MQCQFNARSYLNERFQSPQTKSFTLKHYYSIFSKCQVKWDPTKATLLELGGGPSINIAIVGAPFFSSIVHSDFDDSCNKEVQLWVDRSADAFNWTPVVEYAMKHCEGATESEVDSHAVAEREEEVRRKISSIVHCDATQKNVGMDPGVVPDGGFDVVTACGSLTAGAKTLDEFVQELKNTRSVMKEGGYLCALISGRCSSYAIASVPQHNLYVTDKDVREGMAEAGLHLEELEIKPPFKASFGLSDGAELYCCLARK